MIHYDHDFRNKATGTRGLFWRFRSSDSSMKAEAGFPAALCMRRVHGVRFAALQRLMAACWGYLTLL